MDCEVSLARTRWTVRRYNLPGYGVAEIPQGSTTQTLPFRFREWAELEAFSIEGTRTT